MAKRLFVGNLSFRITEQELQEAFAPWGGSEATIPISETGRSKGFGFVNVDDDRMEAAVSAMNGKELDGRTITVNEARPREPRYGSGGGYGDGGGDGGGRSSSGHGGGRGGRGGGRGGYRDEERW